MDGNFLRPVRWALLFQTLFLGASSLSRVFNETENELDEMINSIGKRVNTQKLFNKEYFK